MFKPPRRVIVRLGTGLELLVIDPPGRFGPRIVDEKPAHPQGDRESDTDPPDIVPQPEG